MASDKPFNLTTSLGCDEIWSKLPVLSCSEKCSKLLNDSIEDSDLDNRLEKIDFADLVKDAKSVARFSPSRQFQVGLNDVT